MELCGECTAIIAGSSPSNQKYLKYKLKTVSTKLSEFHKIPYIVHIKHVMCPVQHRAPLGKHICQSSGPA